MTVGPEWLLVGAVGVVGVLHTIVPDHWVPITLIARQRGWSTADTARASFQAGIGHVLSTLAIASVVWLAGVAVATRFGHIVDTAASLALVAFGGWIAISAWRELSGSAGHGHSQGHVHGHSHAHDFILLSGGSVHGPELKQVPTEHGHLLLSIYEAGVPPRFCLTGAHADSVGVETLRPDGTRQIFLFANHGTYWESVDQIPEPHDFEVAITVEHGGQACSYHTEFAEHEHGHDHDHEHGDDHSHERECADDPYHTPIGGEVAVLTRHVHLHRHGRSTAHVHFHDPLLRRRIP
jgi:hypothetical protein